MESESKKGRSGRAVDSSPDTESYEIINGRSSAGSVKESPSVEDIGVLGSEDSPEGHNETGMDISSSTKDCEEVGADREEGDEVVLSDKLDSEQKHPDLRKRAKKS